MLMRFASGLVATVCVFLAGCSSGAHYVLDGGPSPDGSAELLTLSLVGSSVITLGLGERVTVEVELHDAAGAPVPGESLSFSLDGTPADASIDAVEASTDAAGAARVNLVGGASAASFRLRVSHPRARLVFVDVSVGAAFGTLRVAPTYEGSRAIDRTIIHVFTDRSCDAAVVDPSGGRERALADGAREVELAALPLGLTYTVLARGESSSGALYAAGCASDVTLMADLPTTVPLTLLDTALGYDGSYQLQLSLDASRAIESAGGEAALAAALGGTAGDSARMLDALAAMLEATGETSEAARLRADRALGEAAIALELDARSAAPSAALAVRVRDAEAILSTLSLGGWLSIGLTGAPSLRLDTMVVGGPDTSVALDPADFLGAGTELAATLDMETETLGIDRLALDTHLGALVVSVLEARAREEGRPSLAEALDVGTCDALSAFVAADAARAAACDATCQATACHASIAATMGVLAIEATALDERRARVVLVGALDAEDLDADAHADRFTGDVGGTWEPLGGADGGIVVGACTAVLAVP